MFIAMNKGYVVNLSYSNSELITWYGSLKIACLPCIIVLCRAFVRSPLCGASNDKQFQFVSTVNEFNRN